MLRIKTGIEGLDKLIEGGFPPASTILLLGPPGSGKSVLAEQFVYEGLQEKQPAMFVTFDLSPQEIVTEMEKFGWKLNGNKERLKFVDAYSWRIGKASGEYNIENLGDINELNLLITKVISALNSSEVKRDVFDSLSTLMLYSDPSLVVRLIPIIIAKGKEAGYIQLLILEEGVHDEKIVTILNYVSDGLLEFKLEEDKRFFRISRMRNTKHSRNWVEFDLTDNGIVVKG